MRYAIGIVRLTICSALRFCKLSLTKAWWVYHGNLSTIKTDDVLLALQEYILEKILKRLN
jgi:hypothetical protein